MTISTPASGRYDAPLQDAHVGDDSATSGVSWAAIFAGAAAAAAMSMILLVLGTGLGFASMSPWANSGASAGAVGGAAVAWLVFTSIAASALGGYLAGRLRARWVNVHDDEVYFRDTAHGMLAWAVATIVTAGLLASAITSVVGSAASAGGEALKGAAAAATQAGTAAASSRAGSSDGMNPTSYFVDSLFRSDNAAAEGNDAQTRAEVARIFVTDMRAGQMGPADVRYVGQVVARRTGLAPAEAEKRVGDVFTQASTALANAETKARQVADDARKAAAAAALWMFVALLAGAFFASFAAIFGGRQRDART